MTLWRAVLYVGGGVLLAAWVASAVGVPAEQRTSGGLPPSPDETRFDTLAGDVQAQAARLRERLANAPAPQNPVRNPFSFAARETPRARTIAHPAPASAVEPPPASPEPLLVLIGVAERHTAAGIVRTAMITGEGEELHMAGEGQQIGGRYRVVAVGADAVELKDDVTGATRRLVLR